VKFTLKSSVPDPDPLFRGLDLDPEPSNIKPNSKKNLDLFFLLLSDFLSLKNDVNCNCTFKKQEAKEPFFVGV
jgi:hypothetical protein